MREIKNSHPEYTTITWELTNKCNYSCWYCPSSLHAGTSPWPDAEKAIAFIQTIAERRAGVHIDFIGGEPTLWPGLLDMLGRLPDNVSTEVTTNGSRTIRWWEKAKPKLTIVTLSCHFDSCDTDHLLKVAELLKDNVQVYALLLLDPKHIDRITQFSKDLAAINVTHNAKLILPDFGEQIMPYSDDEMAVYNTIQYKFPQNPGVRRPFKPRQIFVDGVQDSPWRLLADQQNDFRGWTCHAGKQRLHIDFDGEIWAGSCRSQSIGNIGGNINWEAWAEPVICPKKSCNCMDDLRAEKSR